MKYLIVALLGLFIISCNQVGEVVDKVQMLRKQTITADDYHYVVDSKKRRGFVTSDNEIMNGHYLVLRDNLPYEEFQIKDGFLNGFHILFDDKGVVSVESTYAYSYLEGPSITYFANGVIQNEVTYKHNKKFGDEISYDPNGNITYKKSKVEGVDYEQFYDQGRRIATKFIKTIDEVTYDLIVKLDNFENIEIVLGRISGEENIPDLYIFNASFELVEKINAKEDLQRLMYYMSAIRGLDNAF
jgi:antitoxin component YwqK of YwqJK toxin-antitoxin module